MLEKCVVMNEALPKIHQTINIPFNYTHRSWEFSLFCCLSRSAHASFSSSCRCDSNDRKWSQKASVSVIKHLTLQLLIRSKVTSLTEASNRNCSNGSELMDLRSYTLLVRNTNQLNSVYHHSLQQLLISSNSKKNSQWIAHLMQQIKITVAFIQHGSFSSSRQSVKMQHMRKNRVKDNPSCCFSLWIKPSHSNLTVFARPDAIFSLFLYKSQPLLRFPTMIL